MGRLSFSIYLLLYSSAFDILVEILVGELRLRKPDSDFTWSVAKYTQVCSDVQEAPREPIHLQSFLAFQAEPRH